MTTDEIESFLTQVAELPLDRHDFAILDHLKNGSHGWWYTTSKFRLLQIIASKYGLTLKE